ncbi:C40 family peptidase [Xenorhabdus bharatensis]|uniref:C40 family peptidase n=1 Tax=Xenorhabdus bharatensis TaxID=3136256 RepID=UPI0030F3EDA1
MIEHHIIAHAKAEGVREACGLIAGGRYFPCRNISPDPEHYFDINPDDWITAECFADIEAIVHSHPKGKLRLSTADRTQQLKTGLPWWLACGDRVHQFRPVPRLLGRAFLHGTQDCYSLIRDAYHLAGIELDDIPRDDAWWNAGQNLYLDNSLSQGFEQVDEIQPGDIILICLGSQTPCHGAIYLGNQQILHHRPDRISKRDVYGGYWLKYTHSVWRHPQWSSYSLEAILEDLAVVMS